MSVEVCVDITVDDDQWAKLDLATLAHRACVEGLATLGMTGAYTISLLATNDAQIARLNQEFRGTPSATNVLSWPTEDLAPTAPGLRPKLPQDHDIGDIALSYETCVAEATSFDISLHDHVTHLVLHGCLHLLGFDHEHDADATVMESLEIETLAKLGIKNPYL